MEDQSPSSRAVTEKKFRMETQKSPVYRLYKPEERNSEMKLGSKMDGFEKQGQAWFVATELQSDLVVEVEGIKFHLHKFPLLSRSGRLNRLVFESRDAEKGHLDLTGIPGGPDSFELAAKFCYGTSIDLTPSNVAALRCAAEYLEMTEDLEEGNLISKTEAFISFVVLGSWKDSLTVLKSCESLSPWGENLQIVRRCSESIAWKACMDPRGLSWSFTGKESALKGKSSPDTDRKSSVPPDWWFEDLLSLSVDHFLKVVTAIRVKGMHADLLGSIVTTYMTKSIPGLSKDSRVYESACRRMTASTGKDDFTILQSKTQKLVENMVGILPVQEDPGACSFLLRLLRIANMHGASLACLAELEKRIGVQLHYADLADLLVPSFSPTCDTLYDVDLMQRLVQYFLMQEQAPTLPLTLEQQIGYDSALKSSKLKVSKLLDSYLAEIARDPNLPLTKFQLLIESLPDTVRTSDDGLYKAIDTYLKVHPGLTELERKRLCKSMDCHRLSPEACLHASQNERLPLRVVVQVLFSEHMKLKSALSPVFKDLDGLDTFQGESIQPVVGDGWGNELKMMKREMEEIKEKFKELKCDYGVIREQLQRLLEQKEIVKEKNSSWSTGWKKLRRASTLFHRDNLEESSQANYVLGEVPRPRLRRISLS